jgi:glyoxylase-like metal-dependent hydrolase (beta-lactamase superfamily II)
VISHYHADHVGGLSALSKMIPIGSFFSRGDEIEPANQKWLDSSSGRHEQRTAEGPGASGQYRHINHARRQEDTSV